MKFRELAKYLQQLESTSSRIEMTKILAQLFGQATPEDARLIAYLCQGKLGPAYNSPDFGVADKMMIRALGKNAEILFKQKGDLGLVAQTLGKGGKNLSVIEVHQRLGEIAAASGAGSQEKKQQLIGKLVEDLEPVSAKYAVKIVLGKLRTGFSDMTVLDSLSWMLVGNKSFRKAIEEMYNVRADLGEVAQVVKSHGRPKQMTPKLGVPILMAKGERATSAAEIWKRNGACAVEYKLDGLRIQAHITPNGVKLFSRGLDDVSAMYPDIVEALKSQIKTPSIVEGEMIAIDSKGRFLPFQETAQRKRKYDILEMMKKIPLKIYLFDILAKEDEILIHQPNKQRWATLQKVVKENRCVELITRIEVSSVEQIEAFYQRAIADGTEGIFAKKLSGPYQAGSRDFNWIKYKKSYSQTALSDTVDAVVMGYDVGQGKRVGFGIGDFLIGVYDAEHDQYRTIAKIGTGLTDEEWRKMKKQIDELKTDEMPKNYVVEKTMRVDVWAKPQIVVEIHSDEITKSPMHSSGLALRFPRLISWREKKPEDATSVDELKKMYTQSKIGGDN